MRGFDFVETVEVVQCMVIYIYIHWLLDYSWLRKIERNSCNDVIDVYVHSTLNDLWEQDFESWKELFLPACRIIT